jgi:hypothetical protein
MQRKLWDESEVKVLRAMSEMYTTNQMADLLGRTPWSIRNKLRELNILLHKRGRIPVRKSSDWSDKELKILKKYAGKLTAHEISEKIGTRSLKAVRTKAAYLGITLFKSPWSSEEMTFLLDSYAQGIKLKEIAKSLGRTQDVCRAKLKYLTTPCK